MLTQGLSALRVSLNFCPECSCDGQESKRGGGMGEGKDNQNFSFNLRRQVRSNFNYIVQ